MTDNSNAAPERIWALPDLTQEWAKDGGLGDRPYDHLIDGYTEYVRRAEVDALLKAERAKAYEAAAKVVQDHIAAYSGFAYLDPFASITNERVARALGAVYFELSALAQENGK